MSASAAIPLTTAGLICDSNAAHSLTTAWLICVGIDFQVQKILPATIERLETLASRMDNLTVATMGRFMDVPATRSGDETPATIDRFGAAIARNESC